MAKPLHEQVVLFGTVLLSGKLAEPFPKCLVQGRVLLPGLVSSQLDEVFVSAEGDIFHGYSVHDSRAQVTLGLAQIGRFCTRRKAHRILCRARPYA